MASDNVFQGSLFTTDFLGESIAQIADWHRLTDFDIDALAVDLEVIFQCFPVTQKPNESQTEDDLIWPILVRLGWTASLRQQNLAPRGRDDVPDGLLFKDAAVKAEANAFDEEWKRYGFGLAIVESKRWQRSLDRQTGRRGEETTPSSQMLRYLRRVDDLTTGKLRWGILTNGARWRLYYQGARSVAEQFFELDLSAVLSIPDRDSGLLALTDAKRRHWLRVFALVFRREAFLPLPSDTRTFHQRALDEGRFYEERVAGNLSKLVFGSVFPDLALALAAADPKASMLEVREAALSFTASRTATTSATSIQRSRSSNGKKRRNLVAIVRGTSASPI